LTNSCRSNTPSWARVSPLVFAVTFILCALILAGFPFAGARLYAQGDSSQKIWLQDPQPLTVTLAGPAIGPPTRTAQAFAANQAQPLTLVNGRFYEEDGIEGMAIGYATANGGAVALYRGNLDAFAPQSEESFLAIGQGRFPSPFLPTAQLFELPQRPDFLAAGQFTGTDDLDIVAASKGSSALYILANNGYGNFTPMPVFTLPGTVTALGTANFGSGLATSIVVAVNRPQGPALLVYDTSANGLYLIGAYPLQAPATALAAGNLDGDAIADVAVISGGNLSILYGRNLTPAGNPTQALEQVSLPFSSVAVALGNYIFDRDTRLQIALLASDGSLNIVARNGFDPTPWPVDEFRARRQRLLSGEPDPYVELQRTYRPDTWKLIESMPSVASSGNSGVAPVLMRTHTTNFGADDLTVLDSSAGQFSVIAHTFHSIEDNTLPAGAFPPGVRLSRPYTATSPVAAMPMRVNVDGRPGIISLHHDQIAPSAMMPIPDPTFTVNRFDDPVPAAPITNACNGVANDCSLREAILRANGDTVMVPNGTYTLTIPKVANDCTGKFGALSVENPLGVTIVGAGQNTTIIEAGTASYNPGPANGVDMVMNVNEDLATAGCPNTNASASLSNLTLQNGHNRGTHGNDGDGGCMEFDTGTSGAATLTLTNVTLQNCDTTQGSGGGLASFNFLVATGTGMPTITNSIIQGNSVADNSGGSSTASGGGIWVSDPSRMTMTNSQVLNNLAVKDTAATGIGAAGGLFIFSKGTVGQTPQTQIHASTISGNQSAFNGGGIVDNANVLIDQGTIISNNKDGQGASGSHVANGGGLFVNPSVPSLTATLTKVTITGNQSTGTGGGIATGAIGAGPVNISFSRLAGNTAASTGSNLENLGSTVTATNNWWGTNNAASTIHTTAGTTSFDPFIVLTHAGAPQKIRINQSSTLTGDMSKDNHGSGAALAGNLNQIVGLPITFDAPVLGTIPQAQPETLANPVPTATATFNAGGTAGFGTANGTVDQAVVPVNSNLIASATEAGTTATITTVGAHGYSTGEFVRISGVGVAGYNSSPATQEFAILSTPTTTTFTYTANAAGLGASSGGTANAGIIILQPPSITKSFSPKTIGTSPAVSTITFSITNGNIVPINASFTDSLPTNVGTVPGSLVVASTPAVTNTCGGAVTAAALSGSISFLNAALPVGTCTIQVNVQSAVDNIYNNSVTIDSTDAGNGNTASDTLNVINPPHSAKAFGAASIPLNGTTSLTITVSSTNQNQTLSAISFTDSLPAGLVVATPGNLNSTCTGTATAADGSSSVSLSGASLAPGASCTVSVNVQGTTGGTKNNSVSASDTTAGTGNTANATLTVVAPPTISKAFNPAVSIPLNGITTLTFTINNPNPTAPGDLTGVAFSDTLPSTTGTLVVAPTPNVSNTCGGTVTATAGTGVISLSGASVAHNSSCTLSVDVKGTTAGDASNTTGAITSTEGGTGTTSNTAPMTVVAPPSIAKVFNPTSIALNTTTSLQFTITNPAANTVALTGVAFTDTLPTGLTVASNTSTVCGGTLTTTNPTGISLTGATAAAGGTCQFSVTVTGATAGQYTNTTGAVSSTNGGTGNTATANLTVVAPPSVAKAFNPTTVPLNGTTTLTITITNPAVNTVALSPVTLNDILPTGLTVASAIVSDPCGLGSGVLHTTAPTTIQIGGVTIPANGQCVVNVTVTGATAGQYTNTTGSVSSGNGGTGNTASANLTVVGPPTISKVFNPTSIPRNGTSTITFTISNPNTSATADLSGVAFSDTLPVSGGPGSATLVVSSTPNVSNTCGGTVTATAGTGVISLSGASVAHNSSCTLSVDVKGTIEGDANNTTGAISSTQGGTGASSNTATLKVVAPPTISKAFGAANISLNGTTTVTFTITDPASNTSAENGIAFSDTLTNGLQVASTPGVSDTCGGTVTAAANSTSISLTGGSIATPGSTCTIVVNVTGTQSGTVTNTTGAVSSTNGGTGATSNTATLIVASPATVTKTFAPTKIPLNGTTLLTINITNPNSNVSLTGLSFTDSLPAGLVVASTPNLNNTCGGTATATAGSGTASLSGGTLAFSASCAVSVNVQGTTAGDKINSVTVSSTEGGASTAASATVTVVAPPTISKAFNPTSIPLNGTSTVTFTISNPNNPGTPSNGDLTGVAFGDTLPVSGGPGSATLVVSSTPNVSNTCGGTVTATAGSGVISLSGGSVAHNTSCTLSVDVKGTVEGDANNTTGAISSTEGGTGTTSNTATVKVVAPPTISKAFGAANITLNGTTTVTFTITDPASNTSAENGIAFSDTLTNGLQVASTPGVSNTCGGTVTATANSTSISLVGGSIATPGATCTIVVNVTGTQSGTVTNTTGAVSSTNGGTGATSNTATLIVASPPAITKSFNPTSIAVNGNSTLSFIIANPNTNVALSGVAFTDSLPAGLVVAATPNVTGSCGAGTITAVAGSGSVSLSGGTLTVSPGVGSSCTFSVSVTGTTGGVKNNSVQVTSTEGGTGNTSNASITVISAPTLTKAFGATSIPLNGATTLTFTVNNPNTTASLSGIGFSDTLPAGLIISTPNGLTTTCSGTITATQGTNAINLSGASLAASANCTFAVNVTGTAAGTKNNTTGTITSVEGGTGGTASASIDVVAPPAIAKAFNPTGIPLNGVSTLTVTITNPAANGVQENGVAFTDTFPANLVVATPNGLTNSCGGTATATSGSGSVSLTGGTIAVNSSCTVTANVTSSAGGAYLNSAGPVSSTNGGTGGSASATLTVAAPPTINKSFFGVNAVALNGTVAVGFTLTNPNASVDLTGVAFTDNLPAGLVVATPNGLSNNCGGTVTATPGSSTITFTGGTLPAANPTCSILVNLKGATVGVKSNTTGPISANESGPGAPSNTDMVEVIAPPGVAKVFGAATIPLGGTTSLTFTFTNSATTVGFTNVALNDTLPGGLVVANPNGVGGTCVTSVTAISGSNSISISPFNLPASSSCTVTVNVTGASAGIKNNTSGNVTATFDDGTGSSIGITGGTASASIAVLAPPAISKAFNPAVIPISTTTSLTFTIVNPAVNPVALTGVAFTDTLPAGLTVASSSTAVCGGTLTTTAPTGIALAGATVNANAQCQFSVTVTGMTAGIYTNITGAVTSTNAGTGNTATANLTVSAADITISKSHVGNFFQTQIGAIYTITVSNVGTTPSAGTVTVVDTLPASLTATAMSGTGWTCTVATLTCTRNDVLANGATYPAITLTVNVAANAPASVTNTATVSGGGDVNPANNTANDVTTISTVFLTITPGTNSATVKRGQAATFTFTVNAAVPSPITLSCSNLPQGAACSFNPLSPASNGSTNETMLVSTTAPPGLAMIEPQGQPGVPSGKPVYMAMLMLPMLGLLYAGMGAGIAKDKRKKGKTLRLIILGIIMLGVMALAGCGGHARGQGEFGLPTPPGNYTITVTATSGNIQAQTNVTLTVTP
jgi:mucin-19